MTEVVMISSIIDSTNDERIIDLIRDQMNYINSPKTRNDIISIFKLVFKYETTKLFVIKNNDKPIGFAFFNISIGIESAGKYAWINEIHIHKKYRNNGYGSILFKAIIEWCKNNHIVKTIKVTPPHR